MDTKRVVLIAAGALGLIIVALSLFVFFAPFTMSSDRLVPVKGCFDLAVSNVLLPMFTTVVTAALAYIFGKPLVAALSDRLHTRVGSEKKYE